MRPTRPLIVRSRLDAVVDQRWDHRVVAIVAGPGHGKTVLMSQACGRTPSDALDVWVRCSRAERDARRLSAAIAALLDPELIVTRSDDPATLAAQLADALWLRAPTRVGIALDDIHELGDDSGGTQLLAELIDRLPANAHVIVTSRTLGSFGITRFAAQGEALVVRDDDLRFTDDEQAEFAEMRAVPADSLIGARGWPALAELMASVRGVTPDEFVHEQALRSIPHDRLASVRAIAAAGGCDAALFAALCPGTALTEAVAGLPLVAAGRDGWYEFHPLLAEAVARDTPPGENARLRVLAGDEWSRRGDPDRALRLYALAGAHDHFLDLMRRCTVTLDHPAESAAIVHWLELVPSELDGEPVIALARGVSHSARDLELAWSSLAAAVELARAADDVDTEVAALSRLAAVAYNLQEPRRFLAYMPRLADIAATGHGPAAALQAICQGAATLVFGDPEGAIELLRPVAATADPSSVASYMLARAYFELGRAREARDLARHAIERAQGTAYVGIEGVLTMASFHLGDRQVAVEHLDTTLRRVARESVRSFERNSARAHAVYGLAALGDIERAHDLARGLQTLSLVDNPAATRWLAQGLALLALVDGDEAQAAREVESVSWLALPPRDAMPVLYLLRPDARADYDAMRCEGMLAFIRDLSRALVAGRDDDFAPMAAMEWDHVDAARMVWPRALLAEAAVYASVAGNPAPPAFLRELDDGATRVLQTLGTRASSVADTAAALIRDLPETSPHSPRLCVLGRFTFESGDSTDGSTARAIGRERVRSLLAVLAIRRSIPRTQLQDMLWPELDPDSGANNLRVTLSRARHDLALGSRNTHGTLIRADNLHAELAEPPLLDCDLWRFDDAIRRAQTASRAGRAGDTLEFLLEAIATYRHPPFPGVDDVAEVETDRWRLEQEFVRCATRAAELLNAQGRMVEAIEVARRVVDVDRWHDPAYDALVAAHRALGEPDEAEAIDRARGKAMEDLL